MSSKNIISNDVDLVGSLEELGLSKYEAKAYITLIGRGTLGASEIAYYSNLPRTKIYNTLKKLEKKKLSVISSQKPLIASPVPPGDAFFEIMTLHERRLKNMKKIIASLKKIEIDSRKIISTEERKYQILDPKSALMKIDQLIASSKNSINAMLDSWGLNIFLQCKSSLLSVVTNGVKIRLLLGFQSTENENIKFLPQGMETRVDNFSGSVISIDSNNIISIDSSNGKAALFTSMDIFSVGYLRNFEEKWKKGVKIKNSGILNKKTTAESLHLTRFINENLSHLFLDQAVRSDPDSEFIINAIERSGFNISEKSFTEIFEIVDHALRLSYSGFLRYDNPKNIISLHTETEETTIVPWALIISSYLKNKGNETKMIFDFSNGLANTVYLKLSCQISNSA